jgi:hypothetical protein
VVVALRGGTWGCYIWFGLDGWWWIILDSGLVSECSADESYKKGWLVLIRCLGCVSFRAEPFIMLVLLHLCVGFRWTDYFCFEVGSYDLAIDLFGWLWG